MKNELQKLQQKIDELKTRNQFLEEIINNAPAFIYINQVDKVGDTATMKNVWGNKYYHEEIKYSREEINEMGFAFFEKILHPDELSYTTTSIDFLNQLPDNAVFGGLGRVLPKNAKDYLWHNISSRILKRKTDGSPWQFIGIGFLLKENVHTEKQFLNLIHENLQLKNKLQWKCISKKEKKIIHLLAIGLKTEEISKELSISKFTVKTHRRNILKKLKLHNTAALVNFAVENGLN
jgi:DNA-binding CsgD family transcriptional regulator